MEIFAKSEKILNSTALRGNGSAPDAAYRTGILQRQSYLDFENRTLDPNLLNKTQNNIQNSVSGNCVHHLFCVHFIDSEFS